MKFVIDLVQQLVLLSIKRGIVLFNAPYYGQFITLKAIDFVWIWMIAFGVIAGRFFKKRSFWIQMIMTLFIILIPWFSFGLRSKSFDFGPRYGPLVIAVPLLLAQLESAIYSNAVATVMVSLLGYLDFSIFSLGCCNTLTLGAFVTVILFASQSFRKVLKRKQIVILCLLMCSVASHFGLKALNVPQCSPVEPKLKEIVWERSESVTGFVSVVRVDSEYGPILILRCDHSLIGGVFLNYGNTSIFGSFYYMDFVRHAERKEYPSLSALQIGLGIGVSAKTLEQTGIKTDVVEIDPKVYEYARAYFGLPQPSGVFLKDGRQVIDQLQNSVHYDFILHDVFTGGLVYPSLFSVQSLSQMVNLLKDDGVLAMNFVGDPDSLATHTVYSTLRTQFKHIKCFLEQPDSKIFQNIVFYAANLPVKFNFTKLPPITDPTYIQMRDLFRKQDGSFCDDFTLVEPITDVKNPLETLQYQSALDHWAILRKILPDQRIWTDYF